MNIFQLLGDLLHVMAILLLLLRIWNTQSSAGISGKSQILLLTVSLTRYLDLVTNFVSLSLLLLPPHQDVSLYNTVMKIACISTGALTVFLIYGKFGENNHDSFRLEFLLVPCLLLALWINHEFSVMEVLWTFSIYLESVAIIPQLIMIRKSGEAETFILRYIFAFGSYRGLYLTNCIYRYYYEGFYDIIAIYGSCLQTILCCGGGLWAVSTLQWKQDHLNEQFIRDSKLSWGLESQDSQEEQKEKKFTEEIQNKIKQMREIFLCLVSQVVWKTENQPSMDKQNERKDKKGLKEYKEDSQLPPQPRHLRHLKPANYQQWTDTSSSEEGQLDEENVIKEFWTEEQTKQKYDEFLNQFLMRGNHWIVEKDSLRKTITRRRVTKAAFLEKHRAFLETEVGAPTKFTNIDSLLQWDAEVKQLTEYDTTDSEESDREKTESDRTDSDSDKENITVEENIYGFF